MHGKDAKDPKGPAPDAKVTAQTDEFEVYERPPQPGEPPKARGLRHGTTATPRTGIPTPLPTTPAGPPPPKVVHDANEQFEEYRRPEPAAPHQDAAVARAPAPAGAPREPQVYAPKRADTGIGQRAHVSQNADVHDAASADARADLAAMDKGHTTSPNWSTQSPEKVQVDAVALPWESLSRPARPAPPSPAAPVHSPTTSPLAPQAAPPLAARPGPVVTVTSTAPPASPATPAVDRPAHAPSSPHTSGAPAAVAAHGDGPRIALVRSTFNHDLTARMADEARRRAAELGCTVCVEAEAPGVFDAPLVAKACALRDDVDAVVVIGVVIQGETGHDEVVAHACAAKLADLAYDSGKPVGLAVTGPRMTQAQAEARVATVPRHAVESVVLQHRSLKGLGVR